MAATAADLQEKPQAGGQGTDVVDGADDAQKDRGSRDDNKGPQEVVRQDRES